jgi:hypothetical protein
LRYLCDKNNEDSVSFLSAASGGSENLSVFREDLPSQPLLENSISRSGKPLAKSARVLFCLVNSHGFRLVTVSGFESSAPGLIELSDARSGPLLWEKEVEGTYFWDVPYRRFSEDGKYLAVYDGNWMEIINALSGQGTGVVPAKVCETPGPRNRK